MQLQQEETSGEMGRIMQALSSRDVAEREQAEKALHEIVKEDAVTGLLVTLARENGRHRRRKRNVAVGAMFYAIAMFIGLILANKANVVFQPAGVVFVLIAAFAVTRKQKAAARALAHYDDVRGVGLLTEVLGFKADRLLRADVEPALVRLLPRLQATDASLLSAEQRAVLNNILAGRSASSKNTELTLAILRAMEQVGDEKALPVVTKLAAEGGCSAQSRAVVQNAAQECLPYLQSRVESKRVGEQLLRASSGDAGATAPEQLLRPASGTGETPPEQLLRAGGSERGPQ